MIDPYRLNIEVAQFVQSLILLAFAFFFGHAVKSVVMVLAAISKSLVSISVTLALIARIISKEPIPKQYFDLEQRTEKNG